MGFPGGSDGKESACSVGDPGSVPGSGRSPEKEMATPSSILESHGVAKSPTRLNDFTFTL